MMSMKYSLELFYTLIPIAQSLYIYATYLSLSIFSTVGGRYSGQTGFQLQYINSHLSALTQERQSYQSL